MSKTKKEKLISSDIETTSQDCVVFMTAYNIDMQKKRFPSLKKKEALKELLSKYRISIFSSNGTMLTQKGKLKYTTQFDYHRQATKFEFDVYKKNEKLEMYEDEIKQMSWLISLTHSMEMLLDKTVFDISFFINME